MSEFVRSAVAREKRGRTALGVLFTGAAAYLRTWRLTGAK
jgi:hypothetical protein